jgi:hypothetical protein
MAVRFYADFQNDVGVQYRINIYDNSYSLAATEVTAATPGFTLSYEGNNQEQYQPILPSKIDFTIYNEGGDFNTWLNTTVPGAPEAQFPIEILTDPGVVAEAVFWRGILLPEQTQQMDEPYPSAVNLTAADDINQLKETTVDDFATSTQIIDYIYEALKLVRSFDLYASDEVFIRYANDIEPTGYTAGDWIGDGVMYLPSIAGTQPTEFYNAFEVLRSLAITYNARVFQAEGVWHFMPLNKFQQAADSVSFVTDLNQIDASGTAATWSTIDRVTWQSNMLVSDGTGFDKMAGNSIEYSRPIKRVTRERVTRGNEFLFQSNTGYTTLNASANDIELSDDDRLYYEESTHLITLDHNIDIAPVSSAPIDAGNFFTVRADFTIKFGDQYYTDTGWSGSAGTKSVVLGQYYKFYGFESISEVSVQVPELVDDEVGLDVTLNVVVVGIGGSDQTSSLGTHNVLFILRVYPGDGTQGTGDNVTFASETTLGNQVTLEQTDVVTGNAGVNYAIGGTAIPTYSGAFSSGAVDMDSWESSLTTGPYTIHRLGVREIMENTQLPHRIRQGGFYLQEVEMLWPYHLITEDGDDCVIHQLTYQANDSEVSVERFQLNRVTTNLAFRSDLIGTDNPRDRFIGTSSTTDVQQELNDLITGSLPQIYQVQLIQHSGGSIYEVDIDDSNGFMYMNKYIDSANGTGNIRLPKVADNEGRMLRFKSDGTITANKNYRVTLFADEITAGVTIDGGTSFAMDRSYDGIAVLCYDGQWYVIQRKEK